MTPHDRNIFNYVLAEEIDVVKNGTPPTTQDNFEFVLSLLRMHDTLIKSCQIHQKNIPDFALDAHHCYYYIAKSILEFTPYPFYNQFILNESHGRGSHLIELYEKKLNVWESYDFSSNLTQKQLDFILDLTL